MSEPEERDLAGEATEREACLRRLRADISPEEAAEECAEIEARAAWMEGADLDDGSDLMGDPTSTTTKMNTTASRCVSAVTATAWTRCPTTRFPAHIAKENDMAEWQPIESAPDGELALFCNMEAGELRNSYFVDWVVGGRFCGNRFNAATHWMPLPAPPTAASGEGAE